MDYSQYGALALAYMGDCVYEIKIREFLMKQANMPVNMLHRKAKGYVSAAAQSAFADRILPLLTEDEENIYKRGRNAKPLSSRVVLISLPSASISAYAGPPASLLATKSLR